MDTKRVFKKTVVFTIIASFLFWNFAMAAPEGGQVVAGSANISQSANTTTINQASSSAVINWNSFNTNASEAVNFIQPSSSAVALNRITSGTPTTFAGQLNANGQVWILNPAGVLFTSTSKIDVGGLVATTLDISNHNFMNKNYVLSQSANYPQNYVINNGLITAHENGLVALVAPTVENNGNIVANMGKVLLASGTVATLDPYGDDLIQFAPNNYAVDGSVTNNGNITANGGSVVIAANSVNKIIKDVVNNGGFIEANNAVESSNGVVILGGNSGVTNIGGKINSNKIVIKGHDTVISGELKTQDGGMIETSGETVSINSGGIIDAGKGGLWYIDPLTINISDYNGLVQSQLQAGTNVTLSTGTNLSIAGTGDINVDQGISWNTSATLFLAAYRNINVSQPITSNGGSVVMRADTANNKAGNVIFSGAAASAGANVMNGGSVKIYYNPSSFSAPTDYKGLYFSGSSAVTGLMMVDNQADFFNMVSTQSPSNLYNYSLNTDIDATGYSNIFTLFNGTFDGYDYATGITHTISNINFSAGSFWIGGIAWLNAGTIQNVNLVNATVNPTTPVTTEIGGVVGENQGTVFNVSYQGTVASGATSSFVGGIAGYNTGAISYATVNGTVFVPAASSAIGGIAGYTSGTINNSGMIGVVENFSGNGQTGGIAGRVAGTGSSCSASGAICNSFNTALVIGSGTTGTFLAPTGGIVGQKDPGTTAYIHYVYNTGTVLAWPGIQASNVGPILGDALGGGGATFITGWYYDISTCSTCSTLWGSGSLFGFADANKTLQSSYQQGVPADRFDFTNIWTTNGNTTTPQLKPVALPIINTVLGEGALSVASSQPVSIYANNVLQSTVNSFGSGVYGFSYDPNASANIVYIAATNGAVKGATVKNINVTGPKPITGLDITNNTVTVDNTTGSGTMSNTNLIGVSGQSNVPYSASGNNLTLNSGISFLTTATTPYNLNGNITTSGSGVVTFNNAITSTINSTLISGSDINLNSVNDSGIFTAEANGNIILNGVITSTALSGTKSVILSAHNLINNVGSGAVLPGSGNSFLIYLSNPAGSTFGGLASGNQAIWNQTITSLPPASVSSGSHYIFNYQPSLTMTTTGATKNYGTDLTSAVQSFYGPFTGFVDASLYGNVFTQDTQSNSLTGVFASSSGALPTAGVAGSPYTVTGNATATTGYNILFNNAGQIIVNPAPLSITANNQNKIYGQSFSFTGTEFTSSPLQNGEAIGSATITSAASSANADATNPPVPGGVPLYVINISNATGGTFNPNNYAITYNTGSFTVNPAVLNITSTNQTKTYGVNLLPTTTSFTASGLQNSEVIGTVDIGSAGLSPTASVLGGPYAITSVSNAAGGTFNPNNYSINYTAAGNITVNTALLTLTSLSQSKLAGTNLSPTTTFFQATGLVPGETIATVDIASAGLPLSAPTGVYPITGVSNAAGGTANLSNYAITYVASGNITVSVLPLTIMSQSFVKYFGDNLSAATTHFSATGLIPGQTIGTVDIASAGLSGGAIPGTYLITAVSNASGGNFNPLSYVVTYAPVGNIFLLPQNIQVITPPSIIMNILYNNNDHSFGSLSCFEGIGCGNYSPWNDWALNSDDLFDLTGLLGTWMNKDADQMNLGGEFNVTDSVGIVTELTGSVEVVDSNGNVRVLSVGDAVYADETIVTGPDSHMCIMSPDKSKKCIGAGQSKKLSK